MRKSYHVSAAQHKKALDAASLRQRSPWSLDAVKYDDKAKALRLVFPSGVVLGFPVSLISELANVKPGELKGICLSPSGETLSLASADVDISTGGLIMDFFRSLPYSMLESVAGSVRGSRTSTLKKATSAKNGEKGGRPRKSEVRELEVA